MRLNSLHILYHLRKTISWSDCFTVQRITFSLIPFLSTSAVFLSFLSFCPSSTWKGFSALRTSLILLPIQNISSLSLSLSLSHFTDRTTHTVLFLFFSICKMRSWFYFQHTQNNTQCCSYFLAFIRR